MKKIVCTTTKVAIFLAFFVLKINAQSWIQIPDPGFKTFLSTNFAPACSTSGSDLWIDETHTSVLSTTLLNIGGWGIIDLTGVEVFVNLESFSCTNNSISSLPNLPSGLEVLYCSGNLLSSLPNLPVSLKTLNCPNNNLTSLPTLPSGLKYLKCNNNALTYLPNLPNNLEELNCSYNQLTILGNLPASLNKLVCNNNQLTILPALPSGLYFLDCRNNQITCFANFSSTLPMTMSIYNHLPPFDTTDISVLSGNPFNCLPNYTPTMDSSTLNYPICDTTNGGCGTQTTISGRVFLDSLGYCYNTLNYMPNVAIELLDNASNIIAYTTSDANGYYSFTAPFGTYKVRVNTNYTSPPTIVNCPSSNEYSITISNTNPLSIGNNFGIKCSSFDIGYKAHFTFGHVFPGETYYYLVSAGDLTTGSLGFGCTRDISGTITITVNGPANVTSFSGSPSSINGNTAVYDIASFEGNLSSFQIDILTNTTAQASDQICITTTVQTLTPGDINPSNNTYTSCCNVFNSFDPNTKHTTPEEVAPLYADDFVYTIYFQNTGNAAAINIRLEDILDNNLDISTFRAIAASHDYTTSIDVATRNLVVKFANIHLPDSVSDPEGSIGYIQYKIKPIAGLPNGTIIKNTADIYFDYNAPIRTNTTENLFKENIGINPINVNDIALFPNPASEILNIRGKETMEKVEILSINGSVLYINKVPFDNASIDINNFPAGVYLVKIATQNSAATLKFIKK